jgi:hypothetical protein
MEERDPELPVATLRPRHLLGRIAYLRGALRRWLASRLRGAVRGRHAPFLLTGVAFSVMLLTMGYIADHAHRAGQAIDQVHREQLEAAELDAIAIEREATAPDDPWAAASQRTDRPSSVLLWVKR